MITAKKCSQLINCYTKKIGQALKIPKRIMGLLLFTTLSWSSEPTSNNISVENKRTSTITPSITPQETVHTLYSDSLFFNLRTLITSKALIHLSSCLTPELHRHLESYRDSIENWSKRHSNSGLKSPAKEGPLFLSNYEGADLFHIEEIHSSDIIAKVSVSLSSTTHPMGPSQWTDIALLKRVGNVWLLHDIIFDPERYKYYTLSEKLSLSK